MHDSTLVKGYQTSERVVIVRFHHQINFWTDEILITTVAQKKILQVAIIIQQGQVSEFFM